MAKLWRGLTPAKARESAQVVSLMKRDAELRADTAEALGNLLAFAAAQFNVGKNMSNGQAALLAGDMLERYWYWRFDEFALMLKEAVAGQYGNTYDRIDAATVHSWCQKYEAQRSEQIQVETERKHREQRLAEAAATNEAKLKLSDSQLERMYFRAKLAAMSDEQLAAGIDYYRRHPEAPLAADKVLCALQVLSDRKAFELRDKRADESSDYKRIREGWLQQRAREREELEMKETGAMLAD